MTDTDYLRGVTGIVEASPFERLCLWRENQARGDGRWVWEEATEGRGEVICHTHGNPIAISLRVEEVGGRRLLFWHATSQVVDHRLIDAWLSRNLPGVSRVDAMNFHNIFSQPVPEHTHSFMEELPDLNGRLTRCACGARLWEPT